MEISTTQAPRETEVSVVENAPEKNRYLRRKTNQQVRKSHSAGRFFLRGLRVAGTALAFLAVAGFVASVVIYAFTSDHFALRTVSVQGCANMDAAAIRNIVHAEFPTQILRINLSQVQARLEQEIWVRRAEIRRVLPSEIMVEIEERTPAVILEIRGELVLLDRDGVLLDRYHPKYGKIDVPVFRGALGENPEGYRLYQAENGERVGVGLKMLAELDADSPALARQISEVDIGDKKNVKVVLVDDTAEVLLGDRDFLKRFRIFMSNMERYRDLKAQYADIASVDLRFEDKIYYRPRQAPAVPLPESQGEPAPEAPAGAPDPEKPVQGPRQAPPDGP